MQGLTYTDADRAIFQDEFEDWLPRRLFDAHTHIFPADVVKPNSDREFRSIYSKFGGCHTLEHFEACVRRALPGREVSHLSFSTPGFHIDIEKAARYSGSISDHRTRFALALVTPQCPLEDVKRRIERYRLLGYKPYRNMVAGKTGEAVEIYDMLTREQLEYANARGLILMLHIPKARRLADPTNQKQMVELCRRYPNLKVIFAHVGRAYYLRCIEGMLDGIAACPNAYVDTSPICDPDILAYVWTHFPRERVLFASDAPVGWVPGKAVEVNHQYAYLTGENVRLGSAIYDAEHAVTFTLFYYEQLRAARKAAERLGLSCREIEAYFYENAAALVKAVDAAQPNRPG